MLTITPYQVSELARRLMVDGHIDGRPPSSVSLEVRVGYLLVVHIGQRVTLIPKER